VTVATLARLGDLCDQVRGVSYSAGEAIESPAAGYVPLLRANNIADDRLNFDGLLYVPKKRVSENQILRPNDIVIAASSGSLDVVGKAAQLDIPWKGTFGAFCKVLRPHPDVDPLYVSFFFRSTIYKRTIRNLAAGANINNLRNGHLDELQIPLPPLDIQKKIAAVLDKADSIRRKRKQVIAKLDELLQSVFLDMFGDPVTNPKGWDTKSLGEVVESTISGGTPNKSIGTYWSGKFPWVSPKDMKKDYLYDSQDHISEDVFGETNLKKVPNESLLIVVRGMILAHSFPVAINRTPVSINQDMKAMVINQNIAVPEYLLYSLKQAKNDLLNLVSEATHGTKRCDTESLMGHSVMLPDLEMQRKFVTVVQNLIRVKEKSLSASEGESTLFNSLLQRAFKGELEFNDKVLQTA